MSPIDNACETFCPDTFELDFDSPIGELEGLLFSCGGSAEYIAIIHEITATRVPRAILVLASLLDSTGPIAEASIAGLLTFGADVIPSMQACVDSYDADMIRHGHVVLAHLGDAASERWLRADEEERIEAYLDSMGFLDLDAADGDAVDESAPTANDDAKSRKFPAA